MDDSFSNRRSLATVESFYRDRNTHRKLLKIENVMIYEEIQLQRFQQTFSRFHKSSQESSTANCGFFATSAGLPKRIVLCFNIEVSGNHHIITDHLYLFVFVERWFTVSSSARKQMNCCDQYKLPGVGMGILE